MFLISAKMENINAFKSFGFVVIFIASLFALCRPFELDGSSESYGKFAPWQPCSNGTVSFEFKTSLSDALLFYADGIGNGEYYELKLVDGIINLIYRLQNERHMLSNGQMLGDNEWHTVDILREGHLTTLRVDKTSFTSEHKNYDPSKEHFEIEDDKFVYIGGLPKSYDRLQLVTVVHEPHFRGSIQNLFFGNCGKQLARPDDMGSKGMVLKNDECLKNNPCRNGGICVTRPRGVQCDCSFTDFNGKYCELEKKPTEAMFHGTQYLSYDLTNGGGPIESGKDILSLRFRTTYSNGLIFYSGKDKDYMTVSMQHGSIRVSTELGTGQFSVTRDMDGYKLDDGQWHHLWIKRDSRQIYFEIDGVVKVKGTTLGDFDRLSSNILYVGGSPITPIIPGANVSENFRGCLKEVEYTADAMTLKLVELANNQDPLLTVFGDVAFGQCEEVIESQPITFTTPETYIALPRFDVSRKIATITFQFTTVEANSVIIYNGGSYSHANSDFFALEIMDGYFYLLLDLGSGAIKERASRTRVDDGYPHIVYFQYGGKNGFIKVDAHQTEYTTPGHRTQLELEQLLHIGGLDFNNRRHAFRLPKELWSGKLKHGYVGCLQDLVLNNNKIDLMTVARKQKQRDIVTGCLKYGPYCDSQPCMHRGICVEGWNRFTCDCRATEYTGRTCGQVATTLLFDGAQYVSIYLPKETDTQAEDISIRFRTERERGLLLITASSQASDSIEMYLEHGSFKFTINLGTKFKTLSLGKGLNDDQWHTVFVKRRGQNLELAVDDGHPVTDNIPVVAYTIKMAQIVLGSAGPMLSDTYGHSNTDIGFEDQRGPMMMQRDGRAQHAGFVGAMQQFVFNGNRYFDMAKNTSQDNIEITARFDNGESVTKDPVTFETESSYAVMPQLKANDIFTIYFKFKTSKSTGLIMFNGRPKGDFLGLELYQGYLYYIYNMGSGPVRIRIHTQEPLNDNKWHDVSLLRTNTERHVMRVDSNPATVDNMKDHSARRFDLIGPMYLGGVVKSMYNSLPGQIMSNYGYIGCIASLIINGPSVNILEKAERVEHRVVPGCSSSEITCHANSCYNGGRCVPQWRSYACDCDMTSFTGPSCTDDSVTYRFGMGRGLVTFEYEQHLRPSTNSDTLALGIKTIQDYAILVRVDSANSNDYIQMELVQGKVMVLYNMGQRGTPIGEAYAKLNDDRYHVIKFKRLGPNATLQVDNGHTAFKYPMDSEMKVFNDQARVWIGGRMNDKDEIENAYHGTISGLFFNGHRILDYLKEGDSRVTSKGDLTLVHKSDDAVGPPHNLTDKDINVQSTQGTKGQRRHKRSATSLSSRRRRNTLSTRIKPTQTYTVNANFIAQNSGDNVIQKYLHSNNSFFKRKSLKKFIPLDRYVHRNTAQNPYSHSTSVNTHTESNDGDKTSVEKDSLIEGSVRNVDSSGEGRFNNGDTWFNNGNTESESSGYSIFGSGELRSDDEPLRPYSADLFIEARERDLEKLWNIYKSSRLNNKNVVETENHDVIVERLLRSPFIKQLRFSKNTYPKDRGKLSRFKNRREFLSSFLNSMGRKHSNSTTPKQSSGDDIIFSGTGPDECVNSDDEDQCNTPTPEPTDEIIISTVKITKIGPMPTKPNNTTVCNDPSCDPLSTGIDPMSPTTNTNANNTSFPGDGHSPPKDAPKRIRPDNGHLNIFLIIGIVAGVLVALIILVIALYKFRSREEGSYRVDESQNFAYLEAKKQQSNGSAINTMGNGKVGGKKKDVKEWYV